MKNKFYKSIGIFTAAMLLNSCDTKEINGKKETQAHKNSKNSSEINHQTKCDHSNNCLHEQQATCPWCEGGYRYLYKLSNDKVILICEECNCLWVDPMKIELANSIGEKKLKEKLNVDDSKDLFDEKLSHWATKEEAQKSEWKHIIQQNDLLVTPNH